MRAWAYNTDISGREVWGASGQPQKFAPVRCLRSVLASKADGLQVVGNSGMAIQSLADSLAGRKLGLRLPGTAVPVEPVTGALVAVLPLVVVQ